MRKLFVLLTSGLVLTTLCGCGNEPIEKGDISYLSDYGIVENYVNKEYDGAKFSVLDSNEDTIIFKVYQEDGPTDTVEIGKDYSN